MVDVSFALALEALLAVLLIVAALIDMRTFTISNRLSVAVAVLGIAYWFASDVAPWPDMAIRAGVAVAVFTLLAGAFAIGMMGGGDVKLAAALALWFPPAVTGKFLVFMSLAGGLLTLVLVVAHRLRKAEGRPKIPYGVAIAAGGLAILAQRFLNQFV
ncbi:MAG: prepilin peptidase [Sphingomicrobium sp.]